MKPTTFQVKSGPPTEIVVQDEAGKSWSILLQVSVLQVIPKEIKNPDGSPQFDVNFTFGITTQPTEGA